MLSIEGLEGKYSDVRETLKFHKFEQFTRPPGPYIPSWIRDFTEFVVTWFLRVRRRPLSSHQ